MMSGPQYGGLFVRTADLDDDEVLNAVFDAFAEPMMDRFGEVVEEIFSAELAPVTFFALGGSNSELYLFWLEQGGKIAAAVAKALAQPTASLCYMSSSAFGLGTELFTNTGADCGGHTAGDGDRIPDEVSKANDASYDRDFEDDDWAEPGSPVLDYLHGRVWRPLEAHLGWPAGTLEHSPWDAYEQAASFTDVVYSCDPPE